MSLKVGNPLRHVWVVSEATLGRFIASQPQGGQPCQFIPFDTGQNGCLGRAFHFLPVCSQGQGKLVSGVCSELKLAELFISFGLYTDALELSLCWRAFFSYYQHTTSSQVIALNKFCKGRFPCQLCTLVTETAGLLCLLL